MCNISTFSSLTPAHNTEIYLMRNNQNCVNLVLSDLENTFSGPSRGEPTHCCHTLSWDLLTIKKTYQSYSPLYESGSQHELTFVFPLLSVMVSPLWQYKMHHYSQNGPRHARKYNSSHFVLTVVKCVQVESSFKVFNAKPRLSGLCHLCLNDVQGLPL